MFKIYDINTFSFIDINVLSIFQYPLSTPKLPTISSHCQMLKLECRYALPLNLEESEETLDENQKESYWSIIKKLTSLHSVTEVATITVSTGKLIKFSLLCRRDSMIKAQLLSVKTDSPSVNMHVIEQHLDFCPKY